MVFVIEEGSKQPHQLDVQSVSGTISDDVAAQITTEQSEIADNIENLVPRRFVATPQFIVDRPPLPENEQVRRPGSASQSLPAEHVGLFFKQERSAITQFLAKSLRCDDQRVALRRYGSEGTVIEQIAHFQLALAGRMQSQAGSLALDDRFSCDRCDSAKRWLQANAGAKQASRELPGGTIQAGRLNGVQFDQAIIDVQPRQRRQHMLHHFHSPGPLPQDRSPLGPRDLLDRCRNVNGGLQIGPDKDQPRVGRGRVETQSDRSTGEKSSAFDLDGAGERLLITLLELDHGSFLWPFSPVAPTGEKGLKVTIDNMTSRRLASWQRRNSWLRIGRRPANVVVIQHRVNVGGDVQTRGDVHGLQRPVRHLPLEKLWQVRVFVDGIRVMQHHFDVPRSSQPLHSDLNFLVGLDQQVELHLPHFLAGFVDFVLHFPFQVAEFLFELLAPLGGSVGIAQFILFGGRLALQPIHFRFESRLLLPDALLSVLELFVVLEDLAKVDERHSRYGSSTVLRRTLRLRLGRGPENQCHPRDQANTSLHRSVLLSVVPSRTFQANR